MSAPTNKSIAAVLLSRRRELGMSQTELREQMATCGVQWYMGTLSRIESGERALKVTELFILAEVLQIDVAAFHSVDARRTDVLARLDAARKRLNRAGAEVKELEKELRELDRGEPQ